jgi:hypothetical protein
VFVGGIRALSGSLYVLGGFRAIRKTARVRKVGESGTRGVGVMGCRGTGHEIW